MYAWWCEKYRVLPGPGRLSDQDYREMYLNDTLPRIYEAVSHWRHSRGKSLSSSDQSVISWLAKMGAM
jgi:hypothetical protein